MKSKLLMLTAVFMLLLSTAVYAQNSCGDNAVWSLANGVLTISGSGEISDYSKEAPAPWKNNAAEIEKIKIENGITKIGSRSFSDLTSLKIAEMPQSLTSIGERAFYGCSSIKSIDIPDSVTSIENGAFNGCVNAARINMPSGLKKIGDSAFMNIPKITVVTIPDGVTQIGDWAFFGDTSVKAVYFNGKPSVQFGKFVFGRTDENLLIYCPQEYEAEWKNSGYFAKDILKAFNPQNRIGVYVNDSEVVFDQQPVIINDRTLVPVRAIFEAMGAVVGWEEETNTVVSERNGVIIKISIGADSMEKGSEAVSLDVPAQIIGDRTLVPLRAISEAFGARVTWNGNDRSIDISL